MTKSFEIFVQLDKRSEVGEPRNFAMHNIARLMRGDESIPGVGFEVLDRKREPPILDVDARNHRFDLLALLQDLARMFDSSGPRYVRHVHQTVNAVFDFDEGSEIREVADATVHPRTHLIALIQSSPGVILNLFHAEADAPSLGVNGKHFNFDRITRINQLARMLDPFGPTHLRHVDQTLDTVFKFYERAV